MKFHWNFMKKKGPLNEIKALRSWNMAATEKRGKKRKQKFLVRENTDAFTDQDSKEGWGNGLQVTKLLARFQSHGSTNETRQVDQTYCTLCGGTWSR
jgi:hypothetical protein